MGRRGSALAFFFFAALLVQGCASRKADTIPSSKSVPGSSGILAPSQRPYRVNGETYYPLPDAAGYVEVGKASWYGDKFHGRPTSSGEVYDMYRVSAAHKTLPLGTYVLVENLDNDRSIVVRINDRGPFVKGRIVDLSYGAAKTLDLVGPGTADVKVTALAREVARVKSKAGGAQPVLEAQDFEHGAFVVQVGAFKSPENARRLADRLKGVFEGVGVSAAEDTQTAGMLYRVHVSNATTLSDARRIEKKLESLGYVEAFIVGL